ncbi:MAG: hypothetical protein U0T69_00780 [Chitinophagales bacterium]
MKNTTILIILFSLLISITSCQSDPVPPTNPLTGKVKRITYNGNVNTSDFYYNSNGVIDSIINIIVATGARTKLVASLYSNKLVFKPTPIGSSVTDSSVYYSSANKLDSVVSYRNTGSPKQIVTYAYNGSGTMLSYTDYLNGYAAGVPPTYTNFADSNLQSTTYTYNTGPNPFRADSIYYTYSSSVNNLRPAAFGLNFNGLAGLAGYNITTNKNLASEITWNVYVAFGATIIKTTLQTDISYTFDAQNRVVTETRTITTVGSPSAPQIITYDFEYY